MFLSPWNQPVSQAGMSLPLQLVPDAGYGTDRGDRSPAHRGRNRGQETPRANVLGQSEILGPHQPGWPLLMGTFRPCVQSVLFQGLMKTEAMLELVGMGMEMPKGTSEVPRRRSSTSPGNIRTPRCHQVAPWHWPLCSPQDHPNGPQLQALVPSPAQQHPPPRSHPMALTARIIQEQNVIQAQVTPALAGNHGLEEHLQHQTGHHPWPGRPGWGGGLTWGSPGTRWARRG